MGYAFRRRPEELEADSGDRRSGKPPRKAIGYGVLDPPDPPPPSEVWRMSRVAAVILLAAIVAGTILTLLALIP